MSDRREITIGALRLVGEPVGMCVHVSGDDGVEFYITDAEWQSLLAVSALIEAARELEVARDRMLHPLDGCEPGYRKLVDAIDALTTSSRGSK